MDGIPGLKKRLQMGRRTVTKKWRISCSQMGIKALDLGGGKKGRRVERRPGSTKSRKYRSGFVNLRH